MIGFYFGGTGHEPSEQFQLRLTGSSTGAVEGGLLTYVNAGTSYGQTPSTRFNIDLSQAGAGAFSLTSDSVLIDLTASPEGSFYIRGRFGIWSLGPGATLSIPALESADIMIGAQDTPGVPEPGSALLLLGGFGLLEFLRRKVRG